MFDDWETDNFEIQMTKNYTKEQIKILQERILVEESDIKLSRELFSNEHSEQIVKCDYNSRDIDKNINKKMKNEKKYNETSKIIKKHKIFKEQSEKNKNNKNHNDNNDINTDSDIHYDDYLDYEDKYSK